jgi:hypothetical protein
MIPNNNVHTKQIPPSSERLEDFADCSCSWLLAGNNGNKIRGLNDNPDVNSVSFHKPDTSWTLIAVFETSQI